jgi:exosortase F-associated protein
MNKNLFRWIIGIAGCIGLVIIFLFQRWDIANHFEIGNSHFSRFLINRSIRFVLNDIFAMGIIFSLFPSRTYLYFAFVVQLIGVIFILTPYFVLKFYFPFYNGPLLSFLHRLVLNPLLMLLLIPAFYYQRLFGTTDRR